MAKKEPTPNYQLMYQSAVCGLQQAYNRYKVAVYEEIRWTFIGNDGRIGILDGYKERNEKTKEAYEEVKRLIGVVEELRAKRDGET